MKRSLRRMLYVATVVSLLVLAGTGSRAMAHPLGNFTINHFLGIHVTQDTLHITYVVDMAEIPAFTEIRQIGVPLAPDVLRRYSSGTCSTLADGLILTLDGETLELDFLSSNASTPPGDSGVPTLRVRCGFQTGVGAGTLVIRDSNHSDRIGWREMVATSEVVPITTDLPSVSPSSQLSAYPDDSLTSVPDVREATVVIGQGSVITSRESPPAPVIALGSLVRIESLGWQEGLVAVGAALALGTGHALAPGHGKTVVAAYLVGSRGSARQAITLALATAVSHTIGVAILGVIAATAAMAFEPAMIYPYLSAVAGLVVLGIGVRLAWHQLRVRHHTHSHQHEHDHDEDHDHNHGSPLLSWRAVAALGLSGGLVPSASAVILLLGAVHIGQAWFGVLLVGAFGIGMSVALVASGLLAVFAQRWGWKLLGRPSSPSQLWRWVPRLAAGAVITLGFVMTVTALTDIPTIG